MSLIPWAGQWRMRFRHVVPTAVRLPHPQPTLHSNTRHVCTAGRLVRSGRSCCTTVHNFLREQYAGNSTYRKEADLYPPRRRVGPSASVDYPPRGDSLLSCAGMKSKILREMPTDQCYLSSIAHCKTTCIPTRDSLTSCHFQVTNTHTRARARTYTHTHPRPSMHTHPSAHTQNPPPLSEHSSLICAHTLVQCSYVDWCVGRGNSTQRRCRLRRRELSKRRRG